MRERKVVTITLDKKTIAQLQELKQKTRIPMSCQVELALEQYVGGFKQ